MMRWWPLRTRTRPSRTFWTSGLPGRRLSRPGWGSLIDLISKIGFTSEDKAKDVLGEVYEYFLGQFATAEGKKGGQFYTPGSVVRVLVAMLSPHKGRIYDPCCGSGGMFVQSEKFIEAHGGKTDDVSIYGQESNPTTWRLVAMNLAIRGIRLQPWQGAGGHLYAGPAPGPQGGLRAGQSAVQCLGLVERQARRR